MTSPVIEEENLYEYRSISVRAYGKIEVGGRKKNNQPPFPFES